MTGDPGGGRQPFNVSVDGNIYEERGANQISTPRQFLGFGDEYTRPEETGFWERAGTGFLNSSALGELVTPTPKARFKELTMEEIYSDPEKLKLWDELTEQEKAFALLDGTDKAAELVGMPQAQYDRLFGSKAITAVGKKLVQTDTPGLVDRQLGPGAGAPVGVREQAGASAPGAPVGARGGAPGGQAGTPGVYGSGAPGAPSARVIADLTPEELYVVRTDEDPRFRLGQVIPIQPAIAAGGIRAGTLRPIGKNPDDTELYADLNSPLPDGGYARVSMPNRVALSLSQEERAGYLHLSGDTIESSDSKGNRFTEAKELAALRRGGRPLSGSVSPVEDAQGNVSWHTAEEKRAFAPGTRRPATTRNMEVSEHSIERASAFKGRMAQWKRISGLIDRMGAGGLAFTGRMGVVFGNMFKLMGEDTLADDISQTLSGGDLTLTELGGLQGFIKSHINQMKEEFINDERISKPDQDRMDAIGGIDNFFANQETIKYVFNEFVRWSLIKSELDLSAAGQKLNFPINTDEEMESTGAALTKFLGGDKELAKAWIVSMLEYPELN
jgi:hypothetical protein